MKKIDRNAKICIFLDLRFANCEFIANLGHCEFIDFDIDRRITGKMAARPKLDSLKLKNVGKEQKGR